MSDGNDQSPNVIPFGEERARRKGCSVVRERAPPAILRFHAVEDEEEAQNRDPIERVYKARIALAKAERDLHRELRNEARSGMNGTEFRVLDAHNDLLLRLIAEVPSLRRIAEDEGGAVSTMEHGFTSDLD